MTYNIQNQVFQKFIAGPKQSTNTSSSFRKGIDEVVARYFNLTQGDAVEENGDARVFDSNMGNNAGIISGTLK